MNDSRGTVIYEVNLDVDATVIGDYRHWLEAHVAEICELPGFIDADVCEVIDPPADTGRVALCIRYRLRDASAFDTYLADHAPRLRADGEARFGDRFSARRRVMVRMAREDCGAD